MFCGTRNYNYSNTNTDGEVFYKIDQYGHPTHSNTDNDQSKDPNESNYDLYPVNYDTDYDNSDKTQEIEGSGVSPRYEIDDTEIKYHSTTNKIDTDNLFDNSDESILKPIIPESENKQASFWSYLKIEWDKFLQNADNPINYIILATILLIFLMIILYVTRGTNYKRGSKANEKDEDDVEYY